MMTDIVERLNDGLYDQDIPTMLEPLLDEAAIEIRNLRDYTKSLKYDVEQQFAEIERFQRALKIAAGLISTTDGWSGNHPNDLYKWLIKEADANA